MNRDKLNSNITFWLISCLTLFGLALRLIFLDKPEGLWNDEYVSWMIASIPLGKEFTQAVFEQCHMPFYYLYLKFFIHFFGNNDLMLRLTSVLPGIISIPVMYLVGYEFKNKKLGIFCASFTAISSFLIYFSQEVRFYELLFLFSAFGIYYTLKLIKNQTPTNILGYVLSNFLIIFTHTIGFVYVFFNLLFVSLKLAKTNIKLKKTIITCWTAITILTLINLPLLLKILMHNGMSQWWSKFSIAKIGFLFTDYFSPILTNIVSSPDKFFYNFSFSFLIFALVPATIAIIGLIKGLVQKTFTIYHLLFAVCAAYVLTMIVASISGKLVFSTKYSIEIYPTLILLAGYGLLEFKKTASIILITVFMSLNLYYLITSPISAPRLHRSEGHKIVADLIKNADLKTNDTIIINYYPQKKFEKYFNFKNYKVISINKNNYFEYLKKNDKKYFANKFKTEIANDIQKGQKITILVLNDVALYTPMQLELLYKNKEQYAKTSEFFVAFSEIKNNLLENSLINFKLLRIEQKGSWTSFTFIK